MNDASKALDRVFQETSDFIIIGLTGRTGSGCSTAADLLSREVPLIPDVSSIYSSENDFRKYKIISKYIKENWKPFVAIQMRDIITGIILEQNFDSFCELVAEVLKIDQADVSEKICAYSSDYATAHENIKKYKGLPESTKEERDLKKEESWKIYFETMPTLSEKLKDTLQKCLGVDSYTALYQRVGDNIRASGTANSSEFDPEKIFTLSKIANKLIKVIRDKRSNGAFVVLDAIRNPFEATYFHQRYAGFYLVSINTPNEARLGHLRGSHKFSEEQIKALDDKEYPERLSGKDNFISQNIQRCIELSDIHITNPHREPYDNNDLSSQLLWYVSLILHPGLVPPTSVERGMQIAYSAKLNSGCISRQVGAVITDGNYSVKAVGWNNAPEGQTPCILRSADTLLNGGEKFVYSEYERTNEQFHHVMDCTFSREITTSPMLKGRNFSYCFKDIQNKVDGEKNQVHTRSLHAEENAFLQITKYGGGGIKDGILFTTASPCELCSKKAYQLGIKTVFFIDPYPGISEKHILAIGKNSPELILFRGAIGRAYHRLYQPLLGYKDELKMLTGYRVNDGTAERDKDAEIKALEDKVKNLEFKLASYEAEINIQT